MVQESCSGPLARGWGCGYAWGLDLRCGVESFMLVTDVHRKTEVQH